MIQITCNYEIEDGCQQCSGCPFYNMKSCNDAFHDYTEKYCANYRLVLKESQVIESPKPLEHDDGGVHIPPKMQDRIISNIRSYAEHFNETSIIRIDADSLVAFINNAIHFKK